MNCPVIQQSDSSGDREVIMKIIGVTGGIGAGKTTVSAILKEMGAEVIDADHISRMVTQPGEPAWKEIVEHFGEDVLLPDDN